MEIILDPTNFLRPFIAVFGTLIVAQLIKTTLDIVHKRPTRFLENGGMPSSHSAGAAALAAVVFFETGLSLLLVVVLFFSAIILNDALGVRRETTRHSNFLNELIKEKRFRVVGHEPLEVFMGVVLGFAVAILVYML